MWEPTLNLNKDEENHQNVANSEILKDNNTPIEVDHISKMSTISQETAIIKTPYVSVTEFTFQSEANVHDYIETTVASEFFSQTADSALLNCSSAHMYASYITGNVNVHDFGIKHIEVVPEIIILELRDSISTSLQHVIVSLANYGIVANPKVTVTAPSIKFEHPYKNFPYLFLKKLYFRMRLYYVLKCINRNFKLSYNPNEMK